MRGPVMIHKIGNAPRHESSMTSTRIAQMRSVPAFAGIKYGTSATGIHIRRAISPNPINKKLRLRIFSRTRLIVSCMNLATYGAPNSSEQTKSDVLSALITRSAPYHP